MNKATIKQLESRMAATFNEFVKHVHSILAKTTIENKQTLSRMEGRIHELEQRLQSLEETSPKPGTHTNH